MGRLNTNPRDFCREPGYDTAILLTYTFDALFFERIVLPDLWVGGSTDVHVIADLGQINEALPRWVGRVLNGFWGSMAGDHIVRFRRIQAVPDGDFKFGQT